MNIHPEDLYRVTQSSSTPVPSTTGRRPGPRPDQAPGLRDDARSFSARAETFLSARARLDGTPQPSRQARVAELTRLVASGTYAVDGEAIAGAMLADESTARMLGVDPAR
jgi:flagellar biosynthesis anti-sigma factor FlgM